MSDDEGVRSPAFTAPLFAAARQGTKEIAQALPATRESIQPVEEPGTLGNPTQQMVTEQAGTQRGGRRMLDKYVSRAQERTEPDRGMER